MIDNIKFMINFSLDFSTWITDISTESFNIYHSLETHLDDVGLQLWRGSLLLSDFILEKQSRGEFYNVVVVELGAGIGLAGMVAGRTAKTVYLTGLTGHVICSIFDTMYRLQ